MTELLLQKDGGQFTRVYFDNGDSGFKIARENPYFTQSESYTLDVTLPMSIPENKAFFSNIQRADVSKGTVKVKCLLKVDHADVLNGTATVIQVTNLLAKVQLLGGNSELNGKASQVYIDEIDMGRMLVSQIQPEGYDNYNDNGVRFLCLQTYDETNAEVVNRKVASMVGDKTGTTRRPLTGHLEGSAPQPALQDVLVRAIERIGYTPDTIFPWQTPWKDLYVASAKITQELSHALPHWTVKEFLDELCLFFNCTLRTDSVAGTVSMVSNISFYGNAQTEELEVVDEYTVDISQDGDNNEAKSLANANLSFDLSSSAAHVYDCLPDAIRSSAPRKNFASESAMRQAWSLMDAGTRRKYVFECPTGSFVDWKESEDLDGVLTAVDMLGPLYRNGDNKEAVKELKIVPAAITEDAKGTYIETVNGITKVYEIAFRSLSVENPTGNELPTPTGEEAGADIQDLIEGEESSEENGEKEDRLQVFFFENVKQPAVATLEYEDDDTEYKTFEAHMPMTSFDYKVKSRGELHRKWSLSLKPSGADHYLGMLHRNPFSFNMKARHTFRFIAYKMPDPTHVYIIKGKRYGCEKIEANVTADGFDKLMTGYFYEML